MRFLLRMAFWIGLVLILLPTGGSQPGPDIRISAGDAFSAVWATVADLRQFCERQPDACVVGSRAASMIGERAQAGAKKVYQFFSRRLEPEDSEITSPAGSASGSKPVPLPASRPSQPVVTPTDVAPAWRGPTARKDTREPA